MPKFIKIIVVLCAIFIPATLGIFAIKKLFPKDFQEIENKTRLLLLKKVQSLENALTIKKNIEVKPPTIIKNNPVLIERVIDYYTNQDVYNVICGEQGNSNPIDKFIGCNRCPNYLASHRSDYFSLISYFTGSVTKSNETESIFFMHGCTEDGDIAIILKKGYGGWSILNQFKNISFIEPPLVFKDSNNIFAFVGRKKIFAGDVEKEILLSLSFKDNKIHSKDILSIKSVSKLKCSKQFLAQIGSPYLISKDKFSLSLDVVGWEETVQSDCKFVSNGNSNVNLKPGTYILNFQQKKSSFIADSKTQKIITELEKSQE